MTAIKKKKTKKGRLVFQGIEITVKMFVLIQKAKAIRETSKLLARNIYEQGIKDHMSKENILTIINGVFSNYTVRHRRRLTPIELKNVNMVRNQSKKLESKSKPKQPEIEDMTKSDMSATDADFTEVLNPIKDIDIDFPTHEKAKSSTYIHDEEKRSDCRIQETKQGIYFDFKYKELDIQPRNKFIPIEEATLGSIVTYLMREDEQFYIGNSNSSYVLSVLEGFARLDEREPLPPPQQNKKPILEYNFGYKIGYTERRIYSVDGFRIASDKCAYVCQKCGAVFESKALPGRSVFPTDDPRCKTCKHTTKDFKKVCECPDLDS